MVADVRLTEWHGLADSPLVVVGTGDLRFKYADDPLVDASSPLLASGTTITRSYEKWIRAAIGTTGPANALYDLSAYSSATSPYVMVRLINPTTFVSPIIPASDDGCVPLSQYSLASKKTLNSGTFIGTGGYVGDFLVLHVSLPPGISPSPNLSLGTLLLSYLET